MPEQIINLSSVTLEGDSKPTKVDEAYNYLNGPEDVVVILGSGQLKIAGQHLDGRLFSVPIVEAGKGPDAAIKAPGQVLKSIGLEDSESNQASLKKLHEAYKKVRLKPTDQSNIEELKQALEKLLPAKTFHVEAGSILGSRQTSGQFEHQKAFLATCKQNGLTGHIESSAPSVRLALLTKWYREGRLSPDSETQLETPFTQGGVLVIGGGAEGTLATLRKQAEGTELTDPRDRANTAFFDFFNPATLLNSAEFLSSSLPSPIKTIVCGAGGSNRSFTFLLENGQAFNCEIPKQTFEKVKELLKDNLNQQSEAQQIVRQTAKSNLSYAHDSANVRNLRDTLAPPAKTVRQQAPRLEARPFFACAQEGRESQPTLGPDPYNS